MAFSGLTLKLITIVGFFVAAIGFIYAIFIMTISLLGNSVQGWASTIIVILVLGGIQMIMFGIIGEYLWRNLDESRKRPLYFIEKSTLNNDMEKKAL